MRHGIWLVALAATVAFSGTVEAAEKAELPVKSVVLFRSGVGYFEHRGEVTGDADVELKFRTEQINDMLKSMVLMDLGGGKISAVTYAPREPASRALRTFAINLEGHPTLAQIVGQIRGVRVTVAAPQPLTGTVVGVEKHKKRVDEETFEVEVLNLLTDEGLRAIPFDQIASFEILDERLRTDLGKALDILAGSLDSTKKPVGLAFRGKGTRPVLVGYILETPIWKTSYRLVLDEKEKPFLQGWAIVENRTDADWTDVQLSLVSGRPISFIQDLYEPLYVRRPVVKLQVEKSIGPKRHGGAVVDRPLRADVAKSSAKDMRRARGARAGAKEEKARRLLSASTTYGIGEELDLEEAGVEAAAAGRETGELFEYAISEPVTLARQQSAMLPIVNEAVKGEKVSIYNRSVHVRHPLNGVHLTNATELHLTAGPVTVFDGGAYAGDALLDNLKPGEKRLISYAIDLACEVEPVHHGKPEELVAVKVVKGTLIATRKYRKEQLYNIKNKQDKQRTVIIEHPFDSAWKLIEPKKPWERSREVYRFRVKVKGNETDKLAVLEERQAEQHVALINADVNNILFYVRAKKVSKDVKEALQKVAQMKMKLNELSRQRKGLEKRVEEISKEQERIRRNMRELQRNSALYNRYVKKFDEQETELEKISDQMETLREKEERQRKELEDYLASLSVG